MVEPILPAEPKYKSGIPHSLRRSFTAAVFTPKFSHKVEKGKLRCPVASDARHAEKPPGISTMREHSRSAGHLMVLDMSQAIWKMLVFCFLLLVCWVKATTVKP